MPASHLVNNGALPTVISNYLRKPLSEVSSLKELLFDRYYSNKAVDVWWFFRTVYFVKSGG